MIQATLKDTLVFEGVGVHSGEISRVLLHPEKENKGIRFLVGGTYIPASYRYVVSTDHSTVLGFKGVKVSTVEHLMAVLYMMGIDNLTVELVKGWEVPILDGSGYYFYKELKDNVYVLSEPAKVLSIEDRFEVKNCKAYIRAEPSDSFEVEYTGYVRGLIELSSVNYSGNIRDVVFARTFCYDYEVEYLVERGLAKGGSLKNALVIGDGFVYNPEGMRSKDEPLRHKLLDLIGDLSLIGCRLKGRVSSYLGGHSLNYELVKTLAESSLSTISISSCVSTPW